MQIHYALYDPSHNTGGGNYWTWYAETLPLEMLQMFCRDVAVKHLQENSFDMANPNFWDNFAPTIVRYRDWTVIYRFYSGGKDKSNRPGRYIILTAWIKTEETEGVDLKKDVDAVYAVFHSVGKSAKELPVPLPKGLPKELTEELDVNPKIPDSPSADIFDIEIQRENRPQQKKVTGLRQESNKGKTSRFDVYIVALLSCLLGMGVGTCGGVVLQYSCPILGQKNESNDTKLPLTEQKDDSNDTQTGS